MSIRACLTLIAIGSFAAFGGDRAGNGAGGVRIDGENLTFGSASLRYEPQAILASALPGFREAKQQIASLFLSDKIKAQLVNGLVPSSTRKYFAIDANQYDAKERKRILDEYKKIRKDFVSKGETILFAITSGAKTFLFPEFFALRDEKSQAAILFHEDLWAIDPDIPTIDVVETEVAFERYIRGIDDIEIYNRIAILAQDTVPYLNGLVLSDLRRGALGDLYNAETGFRFGELFGDFSLSVEAEEENSGGALRRFVPNSAEICAQIERHSVRHLESEFLSFLLRNCRLIQPAIGTEYFEKSDFLFRSKEESLLSHYWRYAGLQLGNGFGHTQPDNCAGSLKAYSRDENFLRNRLKNCAMRKDTIVFGSFSETADIPRDAAAELKSLSNGGFRFGFAIDPYAAIYQK